MKKSWMLTAFAALLALSACNTAAGFGEDVKNTGAAIEREAEEAKD